MKKTLIALTVAAVAATSANAAVVYEQNSSKVEVNGSLRAALTAADLKNFKEVLGNDGSRVIIKGTQSLGDGLSALASTELRIDTASSTEILDPNGRRTGVTVDRSQELRTQNWFVGFSKEGLGTLTFGRQGAPSEVVFGDYDYDFGGVNGSRGAVYTGGTKDNMVKFVSEAVNGFNFGLYTTHPAPDAANNRTMEYGLAGFYKTDLNADTKLNLGAGWSAQERNKGGLNVGAELIQQDISLGYTYGRQFDQKQNSHLVGFKYQATPVNAINVGFKRVGSQNGLTLGVDHKVNSNVVVFAQYGTIFVRNGSDSQAIKTGLRVSF